LLRRSLLDRSEGIGWESWHFQSEDGEDGQCHALVAAPSTFNGNPRPVVLWLHGTGSSAMDMRVHLKRYASLGCIACAMDTRYHGARGGLSSYMEALQRAWSHGEERPFIYDSVFDLMVLLNILVDLEEVDASRIGITGISLGGMHSWFLAAADERVSATAPMIGVQGFRWAVENGATTVLLHLHLLKQL